MQLRNRKTGQIGNFIINKDHFECVNLDYVPEYRNLAELNADWEDVPEESEEYWFINAYGDIVQNKTTKRGGDVSAYLTDSYEHQKEIGNHFSSREETELALRKLKAWKRLKDKGFKFGGWKRDERYYGDYTINAQDYTMCDDTDLDLLFGTEEV